MSLKVNECAFLGLALESFAGLFIVLAGGDWARRNGVEQVDLAAIVRGTLIRNNISDAARKLDEFDLLWNGVHENEQARRWIATFEEARW